MSSSIKMYFLYFKSEKVRNTEFLVEKSDSVCNV